MSLSILMIPQILGLLINLHRKTDILVVIIGRFEDQAERTESRARSIPFVLKEKRKQGHHDSRSRPAE